MAQFGYTYRSIYTYSSTVGNDTTPEPVIKPFSPKSNGNNTSEVHVTRKTLVPVTTSRPYGDGTNTDDPATVQKYPSPSRARVMDDWNSSPVRSLPRKVDQFPSPSHSPTKLQNETSRPQRFGPVANSTGLHHAPQPTPYSGAEGRKPIGYAGTNINHGRDGYINGANNGHGGGDYGSNKEGRKPIGSGTNLNHDGYHNTNGYGDKEGRKPVGNTIRNDDDYDGYNNGTNYGYGGGNKEGPKKPIGSGTIRNDNHGCYNGYGCGNYAGSNKEGRKPICSSNTNDSYDYDGPNGYGTGGYGDDDRYNKREGHKPVTRNGNYDGHGIGKGTNKDQRRAPFGFGISTTIPKDNYADADADDSDDGEYYNNIEENNHKHKYSGATMGPKISSDWTTAPRKGTQLSEPTHDIKKALELLKMEAAKRENSLSNNYLEHGTVKRTGSPQSPQFSMPINKDRYGLETSDDRRRGSAPRTFTNTSLLSRPPTRGVRVRIIDGRDHDDDYDIIDSSEAEKMFRGTRV